MIKSVKKTIVITAMVFLCLPTMSFGQIQFGLRTGSYAGLNGALLNPASTASAFAPHWEVNVLSAHAYLANNVAYFENANYFKLSNAKTIYPNPSLGLGESETKADLYYNFYTDNPNKFLTLDVAAMLPSFLIQLEGRHSVGLFFNSRTMFSSRDLPSISNISIYNAAPIGVPIKVEPFQLTAFSWGEMGLHYAHQLESADGSGTWALGVTVKYLQGFQGFYLNHANTSSVTKKDDNTLLFSDSLNIQVGATTNSQSAFLSNNASGFGVDLGAEYSFSDGEDEVPALRIGLAMLDLGQLNVGGSNSVVHSFSAKRAFELQKNQFDQLDQNQPFDDAFARLSQATYGTASASRRGSSFSITLPTTLSIQADVRLATDWQLTGVLQQRLLRTGIGVQRDNILAISPRWETEHYGAWLPISLVNSEQLRLGLAARVWWLTIGTDHLLGFFGSGNFNGFDFYAALKVTPFSNDGGNSERKQTWGRNKRIECYRF
jgi:hypothetical protein